MHEKGIVNRFRGVYSAIFTPFHPDNTINFKVLREMIAFQLNAGLHGCYIGGSTGEGILLTLDERKALAENAIEALAGKGKAIVHIGALGTSDAIELAKHAAQAGADAVSAIPPIFFGKSFEAVCRYYEQIAAATALPCFIYNIPGRTGVNLAFDQLIQLAAIEGVGGLKFTHNDLFLLHNLSRHFGDDFLVINGMDELLAAGLIMGAHGGIGSTYNFFPEHYARLFAAACNGDFAEVQKWQIATNSYLRAIKATEYPGTFKRTMAWLGFDCGNPRAPILNYSDDELKPVKAVFEQVRKMVQVNG
ncbi:dihydrodipicolinate synthase family protein [candidate division KSB1 bacterium]|nr:dihydrodipicolinate synthase family protein [candidate division KSB1 bacterium]